jgi:hypothetical protein
LVLGVPIRDLAGGSKAWRIDLLKGLDLGRTTVEGYAFQIETTFRALQLGARVGRSRSSSGTVSWASCRGTPPSPRRR